MGDRVPAVRPPQQRRSRVSYERVLSAAQALLECNGFEGFTVQDVAAGSGVSIGAIYERFGSKETLLRAVHAELMKSMAAQRTAAPAVLTEDLTAADAIAAAVEMVARDFQTHRQILRAFMHLGAVDDVIASRGSEGSIALGREFKASLRPHLEEFPHPEPRLAVDVAFRIVYSTFARQVMYGPVFESNQRISFRRLVAEVTSVCMAYLLHEPGALP